MKAVVLAAGLGRRMRPIIGEGKQKTMMKYSDKPLLQRNVEILVKMGLKDIVMVVNYMKEDVMGLFGDGSKFGANIEYVVQDNPKGGTADAVKYAKEKVDEDKFVLVYGDNVFDPHILDKVVKHVDGFDGVVCGKEVENPSKFGILELDGDHVKKIIEKPDEPPSNLALTGLFVLPKEIFGAIDRTEMSKRGEYELTDSIQILIDDGKKFGYVVTTEFWFDPRDKEEIEKADEMVKVST